VCWLAAAAGLVMFDWRRPAGTPTNEGLSKWTEKHVAKFVLDNQSPIQGLSLENPPRQPRTQATPRVRPTLSPHAGRSAANSALVTCVTSTICVRAAATQLFGLARSE
jgi:hypothetical protein